MARPKKSDNPRWEWRTFGSDLSSIEAKIGLAIQVPPRRTEEIYLLSSATPHSAKIREGALEVKRLLQVADSGLELWSPAFRAEFPVSADAVMEAFEALELGPPRLHAEDYDLSAFLDEIVSRCAALRAITVKKARRQFVFFNCAAEFVRLRVDDVPLESFAVESDKPSSVLAALRELGLDPKANVSFPKGIESVAVFAH